MAIEDIQREAGESPVCAWCDVYCRATLAHYDENGTPFLTWTACAHCGAPSCACEGSGTKRQSPNPSLRQTAVAPSESNKGPSLPPVATGFKTPSEVSAMSKLFGSPVRTKPAGERELSLKRAMERMRTGSRLVHMHGGKPNGRCWFVVPGGSVSEQTQLRFGITLPSLAEKTGCFRITI